MRAQSGEQGHLRLIYSGSDNQSRCDLLAALLLKWESLARLLLVVLSTLVVLLLAVLLAGASSLLLSSSSSATTLTLLAVVAHDK